LLTWRLKSEPYKGIEWSLDVPKWEPRSTQTEAKGQEIPNQSPAASRSHIFFARVGSGRPRYLAERDWYQQKARQKCITQSTDTETKETIISEKLNNLRLLASKQLSVPCTVDRGSPEVPKAPARAKAIPAQKARAQSQIILYVRTKQCLID